MPAPHHSGRSCQCPLEGALWAVWEHHRGPGVDIVGGVVHPPSSPPPSDDDYDYDLPV